MEGSFNSHSELVTLLPPLSPASCVCASFRVHRRCEQVVLPSYAAWFELGVVHDLERQALPDLFAHPQNEAEYISARDRLGSGGGRDFGFGGERLGRASVTVLMPWRGLRPFHASISAVT